jgi:hypothetical protein
MSRSTLKKYSIKALKIAAWIFASFIMLFLVIALLLQFSSIQTYLTSQITNQISQRVETTFTVDKVAIRFPKSVGLRGIYAEDTQGDTLLYAGSIFVDIGMFALLRSTVNANSIELSDVVANMKRVEGDTIYNFQFLIDAFTGDGTKDTIAQEQNDPGDDDGGWNVSVEDVELNNIRFYMNDHLSGLILNLKFNEFETNLGNSDLLNGKYHIGHTELNETSLIMDMREPSVPIPPDTTESTMPELNIALRSLDVEDIHFAMSDYKGTQMDIKAHTLKLEPENIQLHNYLIEINEIFADQMVADFSFPDVPQEEESQEMATNNEEPFQFDFAEIMDWTVGLKRLTIRESSFAMKQGEPDPTNSFNPQDISLNNIHLDISDVKVSPDELQIFIRDAEVALSEEFSLVDLRAQIDISQNTNINIKNLQTSKSQLALSFNSPKNLLKFNESELFDVPIDLDISEGNIQDDLAWIIPQINQYYFNWPGNEGLLFGGRISGKIGDLMVDELIVEAPDFFSLKLDGQVSGLPETDSLYVDIPNLDFHAAPRNFFANLPDTLQPQGIELPAYVIVESTTKGSVNNFETNTQLKSSMGNFSVLAHSKPDQQESFSVQMSTRSFDVGKLLQQSETLSEPISLELDIDGTGSRLQQMNLDGTVNIGNVVYNNYSYEDLEINAQLADSVASVQTQYKDEELSFDIDTRYGVFMDAPTLFAEVELEYAQLDQLGFSENPLLVKTEIRADLLFNLNDFFSGRIQIHNSAVASNGEIHSFPDIIIVSDAQPSDYNLTMRSPLANFDFNGNFTPAAIPAELNRHLANYYDIPLPQQDTTLPDEKYFDLKFRLKPDELLSDVILADLESYDSLNIFISYNSQIHELLVNATWPGLTYGNIDLSMLDAQVVSDQERLNFDILFNSLTIGDISINDFKSTGHFQDKMLDFDIGFNDKRENPLYAFKGNLSFTDSIFSLHISPENLLINGEPWNIPENNSIIWGDKQIAAENFRLHSNERVISIASRQGENYPIVDLTLQHIDLGKITDFTGDEQPTLSGIFDGEISAMNVFEEPAFEASITVNNFGFKGDTIGNIVVEAENSRPQIFDLFASVKSSLTDISLDGTYQIGENAGMDIDVDLSRIDLPSFESFAAGSITDLQGFLTGQLRVTGTTEQPAVSGHIDFNETSLNVTAIDSEFTLENERIEFDRQIIQLQDFDIKDRDGQNARLNGNIDYSDLNMIGFNIDFSSRNFLLMDVAEDQNDMYHGTILMDSDLRLRGDMNKPTVEGRVKLNEGSNFTFTIPQSDPEAIGDEGVVEFVQTGDTLFHRIASQGAETSSIMSSFEMLDVSVNLEVDEETDIKLIIDQYAGDFLLLEGGGVLSFGIDPGGRITLSGRYEMAGGEYLLTFYDVIRRNFQIQQGSNIVWTGEPLDATVDLTAIYTINTNARDLMVTHMKGDQANNPALRQQFPFRVYLKMKGELLEPQITFELELPEEHSNAFDGALAARINQINQNESELNKQVFALLILGNFIQDNPFASMGGGGGLSSTARASASQVLTQQLNRLSDRYIKGVDINFEVQSTVDYTDEQEAGRTQLQMEVSRNFFDDRVRVTVGGNIELEDETRRETDPGDIAGDFKIEYLITPSGNLRVMGFRSKNWADIFDGQVYETGISLIFSKSYNQFRDLFRKENEDDTEITPNEENP